MSGMRKKLLLLLSPLAVAAAHAQRQPNVLLIVTDDLGFGDLAAYGNAKVRTPNIDRLGEQGARCTNAYASSPISGPSRAGIYTGRYQNRFGCEFMPYDRYQGGFMRSMASYYMPFKRKPEGLKALKPNLLLNRSKDTDLPASEITITQLLHEAGYKTALIGKWNVGSNLRTTPEEHGYDYSYYFSGALTRYVDDPVDSARYVGVRLPWAFSDLPAWQKRSGPTAIMEGNRVVQDTGYLSFSLAQKASDFIRKNKDNPFFVTLTFNAPHDPFQAPRAHYNRIDEKDPVKRVYYAMIEALDDAVGEVWQALEESGQWDNTLIIFTSDNGGASYTRATENGPLLGGKCTLFDGGIRVPFYLHFPQRLLSVGQVYSHPVSLLDIYATIAATAGVSLPPNRVYDGVNLLPYLSGAQAYAPHERLFWKNGYVRACLVDGWKLYMNDKSKEYFLFDLSGDPSEQRNLAKAKPEKLKELKEIFSHWEQTQTCSPLWRSMGNVLIDVNGKSYWFPV